MPTHPTATQGVPNCRCHDFYQVFRIADHALERRDNVLRTSIDQRIDANQKNSHPNVVREACEDDSEEDENKDSDYDVGPDNDDDDDDDSEDSWADWKILKMRHHADMNHLMSMLRECEKPPAARLEIRLHPQNGR